MFFPANSDATATFPLKTLKRRKKKNETMSSSSLEAYLTSRAKMPGYTGFRPGMREVIAKTPAMSQAVAANQTPRGGAGAAATTTRRTALTGAPRRARGRARRAAAGPRSPRRRMRTH